jgi:hypothetical protein
VPRTPLTACLAALLIPALLAGCGQDKSSDVGAFVEAAGSAEERAVLETIATYRTTDDEARACELVTASFVNGRFEGEVDNCRQVLRTASRHLPDTAEVRAIDGPSAEVLVDEPTATESIYRMRREDGVWKIDAIVQPP